MSTYQKKDIANCEFVAELLKRLPAHVFWKDRDGKYVGCNDLFAQGLGLPSAEAVIGKTDYDLPTSKEESESYRRDDQEVMKTGLPKLDIEEEQTLANKKICLLTNKIPVFNKHNEIIGVLGIYNDITERKRLQEDLKLALAKSEVASHAKTEFLENMRHDIRTPLTGIVGCAQLLQSENDPKKVAEYANDLVRSSNALLDFHNNILEGIQIATGEIPIVKKKFDLHKQLEEIINLNKSLSAEKKLLLNLHYDEKIPLYLIGDPIRAQRIILELLSNALTFTQKGEVNVTVNLKGSKAREAILEMVVSDTGIGIPQDKQNEIFLRFKRLTPSYQGIYKGLGLGLTTVKQFIDDLGGEIYVNSQPGQGATFTCFIPFQEPLVMKDIGVEEIPLPTLSNRVSKEVSATHQFADPLNTVENRVLIVEDDVLAAKVAQSIMSSLNCIIDIAPDAKTAMEQFRKHTYQLILVDIGLPDMDGIALTHRIRLQQWQDNHATVPIIGLTAHIGQERKQQCLDAGMNAVILKPLKKETAKELLATFVQREISDEIPSSSASSTKGAVMDFEEVKRTLQDDKLIEECRQLMITGLSEDLVKLAGWYKTSDWESVQAIAHKWKGGSSYYGAKRLEQICQKFCDYWLKGKREQLDGLCQQMVEEMKAVIEVCKNYK